VRELNPKAGTNRSIRVLHLEDDPRDAELIRQKLRMEGLACDIVWVDGREAFETALAHEAFDLVIADYNLPDYDGMSALARVREKQPELPVIVVSGSVGEEEAVECLKAGATDYVLKQRPQRLGAAVMRALREAEQRQKRRRAEEALRESEEHFRAAFEQAAVGMALRDIDAHNSRWLRVNQKLCSILGYSEEELLQLTSVDITPPGERDLAIDYNEKMIRGELTTYSREKRYVRKGGCIIWVNLSVTAVRGPDGNPTHVISVIQDINERKEAEARVRRLNRVYAMLSGINTLIVRVRNTQELFREACRIAVGDGAFAMAWIGKLDPVTLDVTAVAWAGAEAEGLAQMKATARSDCPEGNGVMGRSLRERKPVFVNDIVLDPRAGGARRQEALRHGYRSLISLPLFDGDDVIGNLSLYASEPNVFDDDEVRLLTELAGDISYALDYIHKQKRINHLNRVYAMLSGINSAIVRIKDRQELLNEACRIAVESGKFGIAWIGTLDRETLEVVPIAHAGLESNQQLGDFKSSARADYPGGQGVVGRAIRERKPVFVNDLLTEPGRGERRKEAVRRGYRSRIGLPLVVEDEVVGAMVLFASEQNFFSDEEVKPLSELARDVSFALEHIGKLQKLEKLARIRALSGEINAASVRIREREALLRETCRIVVEYGKFELVWVGLLDENARRVHPVAWEGFSAKAAHAVNWTTMEDPRVTLNEVLRTRRLAVRNDIEAESPAGVLRKEALQRGCHSTVCLPFLVDGKVVAAAILFATGRGFFDTDEVALLTEVSNDVSFALDHIVKSERLNYLAYYDALTGLPNRTLLQDHLGRVLRRAKEEGTKASVVMCDIQRFRNINETLGRQGGDALLRALGQRLQEIWPEPDNLGHIAADCFAGVLTNIKDAADVAHLIEKSFADTLNRPIEIDGRELRVTVTGGIALFPGDGEEADALLRNAEAALKKAKAAGERYLFYHPQMNAAVAETLLLENKLRQALEADQFVLHYQPKINLVTGALSGFEALIRWNDPETGLVPPVKFIPLLEETGMILEVGRWAMRKALGDYREWYALGLQPPRIAVNVSPVQLRQKDFAAVVREVVAGSALHGLDLEITESLLMEDTEDNIEKLREVRDMGVNIAIDDFGTGYSSLRYLAKLPVNALKIDRSFIITMADNPDSMSIVSTIISLAHSLNLKVIAEGVESEEQRKFLNLLKCDEIQGYLISKPVPAENIPSVLEVRKKG
jgi:PAS domain S-box-containing protein/diguanylate cyclase (GGDEF)-like protein